MDGPSLVCGRPKFTSDIDLSGSLVGMILPSPHAHARIKSIDTSEAERVPGVACVLHHGNVSRIAHTTAGQGWPEPSPYDAFLFDDKVRFVGDRVAAVAAVSEKVAREALGKIRVDYELLSPVLSVEEALTEGAPVIHDELDSEGIYDARRNVAAAVDIPVGDVDAALRQAEATVETTCEIPYSQHVPLEPHCVLAYFDEDGRLVLRTSTQVPFHVRRIVAGVLEIPMQQVRVVKPRIGGGFGVKQEVLLEPVAGALALRARKAVHMVLSREEEFVSSRTRHPMRVRVALGASKDGVLQALEMEATSNTGAYGSHALTVLSNTGSKSLPLYNKPSALRFHGRAVYTNLPVAGAYRGYGATQGYFPLEVAMDQLAESLGMDPVELRLKNHIREGETSPIFEKIGEGREGVPQVVRSCKLAECLRVGAESFGWQDSREAPRHDGAWSYGVGMACAMQGSGITGIDMGSATLMMNEDGSFRLLVGATDLGTGSDTVLAQIAAEVLGVPVERVMIYSSDTDFTPFDVGAYASSTTYVSGTAVLRAAQDVRRQILTVAGALLSQPAEGLELVGEQVRGLDGKSVSLGEVGHRATYVVDQHQIAATASCVPEESPPPFAAFFAEVGVDRETGIVRLERMLGIADCGVALHPRLAEGQLEGAMAQGVGQALFEEMSFSERGRCVSANLLDYKIPTALDVPLLEAILLDSYEPSGPLGAKSIAEIGINGPLPALSNAIHHAVGLRLTRAPFTPERVLGALDAGR
ncbi:MAG: molybdopterin cofactor-binding domain-containing protein [Candidatus Bipolaricaulota bacterium]